MKDIDHLLLMFGLPITLLGAVIEGFVLVRKHGYDWKATGLSLLDVVFRQIVKIFSGRSLCLLVGRRTAPERRQKTCDDEACRRLRGSMSGSTRSLLLPRALPNELRHA